MKIHEHQVVDMEQKITAEVIRVLLSAGFKLSVFNGEEYTVRKSTDPELLQKALFTADIDHLFVYKDGEKLGWVMFVYGNDGWDVVSDYTVNLEEWMSSIQEFSVKQEAENRG